MPQHKSSLIVSALLCLVVASAAQAAEIAPSGPSAAAASAREKPQNAGQGPQRQFTHMDRDRNGKISFIEFTVAQARQFAELDTNKDGGLTAQEMSEAASAKQGALRNKMAELRAQHQALKDKAAPK